MKYIKYPRTKHVIWSESITSDDKIMRDTSNFEGKRVIVTEKLDGENTTIYNDHIHARSIDSKDHWSRSWVKQIQGEIGWKIKDGVRICGENLFAKHSIKYTDLSTYFFVFSIWYNDKCLDWNETKEMAHMLGLTTVPVLYDGLWDVEAIKSLYHDSKRDSMEGYVVRLADSFTYDEFNTSVCKFVRKGHVQTSSHWMHSSVEKNELIKTEL